MAADLLFLATVKAELTGLPPSRTPTWHQHSRDVLMPLLDQLEPAHLLTDLHDRKADGLLLSNADASDLIAASEHIPIPIFTKNRKYNRNNSPMTIEDLLYSDKFGKTETLDVQISSDPRGSEPRPKTITEIRKRFADTSSKQDPWNILGASNTGDCPLPAFLDDEHCEVLVDVTKRAIQLANQAQPDEREDADEDVDTWKKALSWILLAEAGALTTTHQDALGLGTWISCQQGQIGFAWLSRPTEYETRCWQVDPDHFIQGKWCFKVLRPGETIYFDPGLIHFVFRSTGDDQQTLALGGHTFRRAIAGTCARILDEHIGLITAEDLIATEPRSIPLPYNESVSYVLKYGEELLKAVRELLAQGPALQPDQASMFQHYSRRLLRRIKGFRKISDAVEASKNVRDMYAKDDQHARVQNLRQDIMTGQHAAWTSSRKRPRDEKIDEDADGHTSLRNSARDAVLPKTPQRREYLYSRAEARIRAVREGQRRSESQHTSAGRQNTMPRPAEAALLRDQEAAEAIALRCNPGRKSRPTRLGD